MTTLKEVDEYYAKESKKRIHHINPDLLTTKDLKNYYEQTYPTTGLYDKSNHSFYFDIKRKNIIKNYICNLKKEKRKDFLDLGCGDGTFLFDLQNFCNKLIGIDIAYSKLSATKKKKAIKNYQFIVASAENLPIKSNVFSIVLCSEVIEHLKKPESCISELYRVTKIGGKAIITTQPAYYPHRIFTDILGIRVKKTYKHKLNADGHIWEFNPKDLVGKIRKIGFRPIKIQATPNLVFHGITYLLFNNFLFQFLSFIDRLMSTFPPINRYYGEHLIIIAEKLK
ncbi:class I SAM-dependent methyltransferase [candidate division WOR-3 bacterium]|nr:class I SAM-dependent methyltransferase [candidate division WOR-3 bacterium]